MEISSSQTDLSQTQIPPEMVQMIRDKIENDFPDSMDFYKKMEDELSAINSELDILLDQFENLRAEAFIDQIEWLQRYKNSYELVINMRLQHKATEDLLNQALEKIGCIQVSEIENKDEDQESVI